MGHSIGDGIIVVAIAFGFVAYWYFRHQERRRRMEIIHQERLVAMEKGIPLPELPLDPPSVSKPPDPRAPLQDQRRKQAVLECVAELPGVYQSALRLHYWVNASISEMFDAPENTVKSYLHRARRLLHVRLSERGFDDTAR